MRHMKKYYLHTAKFSDACGGLGIFSGFFIQQNG